MILKKNGFGVIEKCFDALILWRLRAEQVQGSALPGGHYLAGELLQELVRAISPFFR
jgi:haloacetate dehalogenase